MHLLLPRIPQHTMPILTNHPPRTMIPWLHFKLMNLQPRRRLRRGLIRRGRKALQDARLCVGPGVQQSEAQ